MGRASTRSGLAGRGCGVVGWVVLQQAAATALDPSGFAVAAAAAAVGRLRVAVGEVWTGGKDGHWPK